jgi:opacity protein-like surface antigen
MKKTILTIAGSALVIFSAVQFASAAEPRQRAHHRAHSEFRNSNAFAAPAYEPASEASRYSGGYAAPAGH